MDLRKILKNWRARQAVTIAVAGDVTDAGAATAWHELGVRQRQHAQYAEAARSLARAIELKHDFGEAHHDLGMVYLEQRQFEDAADSLELATHFAPRLIAAHLDLGAALIQLGRYDAAESALQRALALEPDSPDARVRLGNLAKMRGNLEQAAEYYRAAIKCDATRADVHCQLAFVLYKLGHYDASHASHAAALAINPAFPEVHHNLGLLLLETGCPDDALASFERALSLRPESLPTRACVAHALRDLGRLDEALAAYDAVLAEQPQFGDALINRCYALLMREDYSAGWNQYEQRFMATATPLRGFPFPEWRGEPLSGSRILVYAEQGLGDEIMFASCIADLQAAGAHVVLECGSRLATLFARSFPQVTVHGGDKNDDKGWLAAAAPIACQVAIGSLPRYFRGSRGAFPRHDGYLVADARRVEAWRRRLNTGSKRLRVGIAWSGGSLRTRRLTRSIPLAQWLPLLRQPRVQFVSLQFGDAARELTELPDPQGKPILEFGGELSNIEELAALICALDIVISVDNTVAHLAGALGQRVWILLASAPEWRYPRQGVEMPWYPSARLFRQSRPRIWTPVLEQVGQALKDAAGAQYD